MDENKQVLLNQKVDFKIWSFVRIYGFQKNLTREEALEELILLGWAKHKENEDKELD